MFKPKSLLFKIPILILLIPLLLSHFALPAFAQTPASITVTPSIMRLDLSTDPPDYEIIYKNNQSFPIDLNFSAQDFSELEDAGRINFLEPKDAANYKYSLSSWISLEKSSLSLNPGEEGKLKISVDKSRLPQGGHYASILAQIQQKETQGNVKIQGVLSSLLFVRAGTGAEVEEGQIQEFKMQREALSFPENFSVKFQNSGNVELIPTGVLEIKNPLGQTVAKGILNEGSLMTLPETIRTYDIKPTRLETILIPGNYTANLTIHFGKTQKELHQTINFFSEGNLHLTWILVIIVTITALLLLKRKLSL